MQPKQPDMKKADRIFAKIDPKLTPKYKGKIVAIDTDSEKYYLGEDELDAYSKAVRHHPGKLFAFMRVGYKYVYFIGALP